jgi:alcohol dehydrogenase class IV
MLPHSMGYNLASAPEARRTLVRVFGNQNPALALEEFARGLSLPRALREVGMPEAAIDAAAELAVINPYPNPRTLERNALRGLLARAWAGVPPEI